MNKFYEFENTCGACAYMDLDKYRGYRFYCQEDWDYYELTKSRCRKFVDIRECSNCKQRDYYDLKRANRGDCYLTTIICDLLGFSNDCEILAIMRMFRNNVLQKDLRYLGILMEYDVIGSTIANNLKNDENAIWIAKELLENFIKPIILNIKNNDYQTAINIYLNMTNILKENYGISEFFEGVENYDQFKGGHGRVYTKVNS